MSVLLTAANSPDENSVHVSNGEWAAIVAASLAFNIQIPKFSDHSEVHYSPGILTEMAERIEQLKDAPEWLRGLADAGGATLS